METTMHFVDIALFSCKQKPKLFVFFWAGKARTAWLPSTACCLRCASARGLLSRTGTQLLESMRSRRWHDCSSGSGGFAKEVNADCWHELIAIPICDVNPTPRRAFRASGQWRTWKYRGRQLFPTHQTPRLSTWSQANSCFHPNRETRRKDKFFELMVKFKKHFSELYPRGFQPHLQLMQVIRKCCAGKTRKNYFARSCLLGLAWQTLQQRKCSAVLLAGLSRCQYWRSTNKSFLTVTFISISS